MSSKNPQIFVTRLPRDINEDDLKKTFRKFGKIKEVTLKRGFGFVVSIFSDLSTRNFPHEFIFNIFCGPFRVYMLSNKFLTG